jgi:hypothetical protein
MNKRTKHKLGGLKPWKEGLKTQEGTLIAGYSLKRNLHGHNTIQFMWKRS